MSTIFLTTLPWTTIVLLILTITWFETLYLKEIQGNHLFVYFQSLQMQSIQIDVWMYFPVPIFSAIRFNFVIATVRPGKSKTNKQSSRIFINLNSRFNWKSNLSLLYIFLSRCDRIGSNCVFSLSPSEWKQGRLWNRPSVIMLVGFSVNTT